MAPRLLDRAWPLAAFAGVVYGLSPVPRDLWALGFWGGAFLFAALDRARTAREGFVAGWLTCFGINAIVLAWIVPLLMRYGGFPVVAALPTAALLWGAQALAFGFAGAAVVALRDVAPPWVTLPVALPAATVLVPAIFPWHVCTSQLAFLPWVQCAELSGPATADVPLLFAGTALAQFARTRSRAALVVLLVSLAVPPAYGLVRLAQVRAERATWPTLAVGLVQPNVDIPEKFDDARFPEHLETLHALSREAERDGAQLVVWPETSYPYPLDHRRVNDAPDAAFSIRGAGARVPRLVGVETLAPSPVPGFPNERYNSAVAVDPDGRFVGVADKVELLAFGEYVPFWDELTLLHTWFATRGISAGPAPVLLHVAGADVLVLNCYEDVLGPYTARAARLRPSLLVNVTNDAWFGDTDEPWLHDGIARFRAIETRTDLVRAVNTGISTHVEATGEEPLRTGTFVEAHAVARTRLRPRDATPTPYVLFGDWLTPSLCALLLAWAALAASAQKRRIPVVPRQ